MKRFSLRYQLLVLTVVALSVWGLAVNLPFLFRAGDVISAEQMNETLATLNEGKQERVEGTCAAGSSIRTIGADGTVACEVDDLGSGSGNAGVDAINGMTGAVTLQAGDNITIDDSQPGQLVLSASSGGTNSNGHDHFGQSWTGEGDVGLTVVNTNTSPTGAPKVGVLGRSAEGSGSGGLSQGLAGVWGDAGSGYGVYGSSASGDGVRGESASSTGVFGVTDTGIGVRGNSSTRGVVGTLGSVSCAGTYGVGGCAATGDGVVGRSESGYGVFGGSTVGNGIGGFTTNGIGVWGKSDARGVVGTLGPVSCAGSFGVGGCAATGLGVYGRSASNFGVLGESGTNNAVYGVSPEGVAIAGTSTNGYAAYLEAGNGVGGFATCTFRAGTTNWSCSSDRNLKENFEPVNPTQVLEAVAAMPVTTWTMKGSDTRQLGPAAQDFYAAFGLGDSDTSINNTDAQGVALAAIQGLYQRVQEQQAQIEALEARLTGLE